MRWKARSSAKGWVGVRKGEKLGLNAERNQMGDNKRQVTVTSSIKLLASIIAYEILTIKEVKIPIRNEQIIPTAQISEYRTIKYFPIFQYRC